MNGRRVRPAAGWKFKVTDKLDDQPPGVWESLTDSGSLFVQERFLRTAENAGPAELRPRYVTALRDGRPALAVATQLVELSGEALLPEAFSLLRKQGFRVLVCGSALSCGLHGVAMAEGEPPAQAWHAVAQALERISQADGLSRATDLSLVKDVPQDLRPANDALIAAGYRSIDNEPNMVLRLDPSWGTHQGYLSAMTSKYRRSFEKIFRRVEQAGYRVEPLEDVASHADTLHELYLHVQRRARLRAYALPPGFLPALAAALGPDLRLLVLRGGAGEIVGFVTCVRDGTTVVGYFMGYDPEINQSVPIYLRLLHSVVEQALRTGCNRVSFGRTALEPKARLGAEPVALSIWARHRQPALHDAAERWLRTVLFEQPPSRRPFG